MTAEFGGIFWDLFYIYYKIPDIFEQWRNIWDLLYLYCKIPDIFRQWRNMVGSIFYVLQNFWSLFGGGIFKDLLYLYCKIPDIDKTDSFWKWQEKPNQYPDQIVRWPRNFESFLTIILFKMTTEFFWNSLRILVRILVASLSFQSFKWLLSSWRIRWPQNSCEILQGFHNFNK